MISCQITSASGRYTNPQGQEQSSFPTTSGRKPSQTGAIPSFNKFLNGYSAFRDRLLDVHIQKVLFLPLLPNSVSQYRKTLVKIKPASSVIPPTSWYVCATQMFQLEIRLMRLQYSRLTGRDGAESSSSWFCRAPCHTYFSVRLSQRLFAQDY